MNAMREFEREARVAVEEGFRDLAPKATLRWLHALRSAGRDERPALDLMTEYLMRLQADGGR